MRKPSHSLAILSALGALLFNVTVGAHNLAVEEQTLHKIPIFAPDESDFSFENPHQLDYVEDSQAIFAYLTPHDVDVYEFTLAPADVQYGPVIISASALPPACLEYQWEYPVTALIGFGLPAPDPAIELPFDVPPGMGIVVADNPWVLYPNKREIFNLEEGHLGDISWFLPEGLSQDCLLNAPYLCDFTNTIAQPVFAPGTYYIAIWNPTGIPTDYTANVGTSEENFVEDEEVEELVADNKTLHRSCNTPYPFR